MVGYFLAAFIFGRKLPDTTGITIPELLEDRYNERTRALSAPFYILRLTSSLAAQWVAGGVLINFLLGDLISPDQGIVIAAAIVFDLYVLWRDVCSHLDRSHTICNNFFWPLDSYNRWNPEFGG